MKAKKAAALLLACVLLLTLFSGCSKRTSTSGKMHYDLSAEPVNLDPQTASDLSSMTVINQIFEPLFTLDENGEILPAAAERYTVSADGTQYQILLRSGMRWQNGDFVDADDYAFGLQRVLLSETQSPYAAQFYGITNAKAFHDGKVRFSEVGVEPNGLYLTITLTEPDEYFLNLLSSTAAMPCQKKFFESTKGKYGLEANATLANGPFYLQTWAHDQYLKLTRNANYRDSENVRIAGVTMWTNNTENREETFWKGNTHACYVNGRSYAARDTSGYTADAISNTVYGVVFSKNSESLQNTNIRKALALLFDRSGYADALPVYLTVTDRAFASDCAVNAKPYVSAAKEMAFDAEKAVELYQQGLKELGVNGLSGLKIVVLEDENLPNGDYFLKLSQNYQKYLDLYIGITRLPAEEYEQAIASGEYDLAIVPVVAEDLSPLSMLEDFASGSFACADAEFTGLYQKLKTGSGDTLEILQQAERILLENGWFIPMYERSSYFVCGRNTTGITYNSYTGLVSFRYAEYLDE